MCSRAFGSCETHAEQAVARRFALGLGTVSPGKRGPSNHPQICPSRKVRREVHLVSAASRSITAPSRWKGAPHPVPIEVPGPTSHGGSVDRFVETLIANNLCSLCILRLLYKRGWGEVAMQILLSLPPYSSSLACCVSVGAADDVCSDSSAVLVADSAVVVAAEVEVVVVVFLFLRGGRFVCRTVTWAFNSRRLRSSSDIRSTGSSFFFRLACLFSSSSSHFSWLAIEASRLLSSASVYFETSFAAVSLSCCFVADSKKACADTSPTRSSVTAFDRPDASERRETMAAADRLKAGRERKQVRGRVAVVRTTRLQLVIILRTMRLGYRQPCIPLTLVRSWLTSGLS